MPDPRSSPSRGVTVVIPALNEEWAIGCQLRDIAAVLDESGWAFEIIVVDDGSTDATTSIARSCGVAGVEVLRLDRSLGYGNALKTGIQAARYDWILISDADGSYPASAIPGLLAAASGACMVVGARTGANVHAPLARRPAKWLLRQYAMLVTMHRIPDLNSGLRLFDKSVARAFWSLYPAGFSFTTTITMAMLATGQEVRYVKIDYHRRIGESKISPADFFRILWLITKLAIRFRPLRIFVPAGLAGLLAAKPYTIFAPAIMWAAGLLLERRARAARRVSP